MSEELELAAKAVQEVLPAVEDFAEAAGLTAPVRELASWVTDLIRYRRAPHQAKLLVSAAAKVRASGLPPRAVSDKLLRAVLEEGPLEDDENMRDRWANLLANGCTDSYARARPAYVDVLRQLEPIEAQMLDQIVRMWDIPADPDSEGKYVLEYASDAIKREVGIDDEGVDNLERLGLIRFVGAGSPKWEDLRDLFEYLRSNVIPTAFGLSFVRACQPPQALTPETEF